MNPAQIKKMMMEAQKLQAEMAKKEKKLKKKEYSKVVGGAISVSMNGNYELLSIDIKPEVIDPEDKEFLEDMIKTAINGILTDIHQDQEAELGSLTQGMPF